MGSLSLLQGIFPTQGSNPGLPHGRWILYQLSPQGSPSYGVDVQNTGGKRLRTCHSHAGPQFWYPFIPPFSTNVPPRWWTGLGEWTDLGGDFYTDGRAALQGTFWKESCLQAPCPGFQTYWPRWSAPVFIQSHQGLQEEVGSRQSPIHQPTPGSQDFQQNRSLPLATGKWSLQEKNSFKIIDFLVLLPNVLKLLLTACGLWCGWR